MNAEVQGTESRALKGGNAYVGQNVETETEAVYRKLSTGGAQLG